MKRFHVHITVNNLEKSIDFYSKLFGQQPSKQEQDYAKWMLDDPRVNFAISTRQQEAGLDHFGFQVETAEELEQIKGFATTAAEGGVMDQGVTTCCYANSEKHWTIDPQGLAWEHFLTLSDAKVFGDDNRETDSACCIPMPGIQGESSSTKSACCVPGAGGNSNESCCN